MKQCEYLCSEFLNVDQGYLSNAGDAVYGVSHRCSLCGDTHAHWSCCNRDTEEGQKDVHPAKIKKHVNEENKEEKKTNNKNLHIFYIFT